MEVKYSRKALKQFKQILSSRESYIREQIQEFSSNPLSDSHDVELVERTHDYIYRLKLEEQGLGIPPRSVRHS